MPPSIRRLVLLSLLKLLTTACIHAESDKRGHLVGSVSLPDGTPVSGAMISVINEDRMFSALLMSPQPITKTDKTGRFRTELLPHGTYTVLVFGNKTHVGLSARPASGVTLPSGSSAPPDLILEKRLTTVLRIKKKIKYQSSGGPFYYLKSPIHPLVNGLATKALFLRLGSDQLNISVIPGPFQISPDASFHPESEIHTFEVTADGTLTGPKTLPALRSIPVKFEIEGPDENELPNPKLSVVPVAMRAGHASAPFRVFSMPDRNNRKTMMITRGVRMRAVATAPGFAPTESNPFTPRPDMAPIKISLSETKTISLTCELQGLPEEFLSRIGPNTYQWYFEGPKGVLHHGLAGGAWASDSPASITLNEIPDQIRLKVFFQIGGKRRFSGRAQFIAREGARPILEWNSLDPPEPER